MSETCAWVADRLPEYHLGRLSAGERRALEAHVAECASCARESATVGALRRAPVPLPPPARWERLVDHVVEGAMEARARRRQRLRLLPVAAALVLATGLSGLWWRTQRPGGEGPVAEDFPVPVGETSTWTAGLPWGESEIPGGFTLEDLSASELEALLQEVDAT